ncbi:MAG: FHA domain-containing protein [Bryobacteraceae bacterium]
MAAFHACPKGHQSSESDFCSECGAKIQGAPIASGNGSGSTVTSNCPDCGAPVPTDGSIFCEICGYNFRTRAHGQIPMRTDTPAAPVMSAAVPTPAPPTVSASAVDPTPAAPATVPAQVSVIQAEPSPVVSSPPVASPVDASSPMGAGASGQPMATIELMVTVDPSLRESNSPEAPAIGVPQVVPLDRPVVLIGRRSDTRAIFPEVSLDQDTAVSHRHAILTRSADGGITLRDIGSANGTRLNGRDVPPMTDVAIHDGDQVTLGHWTRIAVKAKA